uniref:DNA-directed RNA polymerase n=1 Tax=Rhabditophanes sp. KR3021 TaxID=114890 RepID=A0AC35TFW0_9BILA
MYRECVKDAKRINLLAECVVNVLNVRDRMVKDGTLKLEVEEKYPKLRYYDLKKRKRIHIPIWQSRIKRNNLLYHFGTKTRFVNVPINEDLEKIRLQELKLPFNLRNLKRLERYQKMSKHVKEYCESISKTNEKMLTQFSNPIKMKIKEASESEKSVSTMLEEIVSFIKGLASSNKYSFLSPRLFNIVPGCVNKCKNRFLSPSMFSFHKDDGILPLPDVMSNVFSNSEDTNLWLNFLIEISGASDSLHRAVNKLGPKMLEMEEQIYPTILSMQRMEDKINGITDSYDHVQKNEIERKGYTFMNEDQAKLLYSDKGAPKLDTKISDLVKMTKEELELRIEKDIRLLAQIKDDRHIAEKEDTKQIYKKIYTQGSIGNMDNINGVNKIDTAKRLKEINGKNSISGMVGSSYRHSRLKRDETDPEAEHSEKGIHFLTLAPFAFYNRIEKAVTLELVTLSPHAFLFELMSSEALSFHTLSPRAFVASLLTPTALIGRVLSPGAFRFELLSPRFLTLWVLSPEAGNLNQETAEQVLILLFVLGIIEILTPKFMDLKILSGERGIIQILSPRILSSHIYSPATDGILILSPSILSPGIGSEESQFIEVLSPHILSNFRSLGPLPYNTFTYRWQ